MIRDTTGEPRPSPSTELLDYLRQIADRPDAPDDVKADARDYLEYLEATPSGSSSFTGEACMDLAVSAALQHGREVLQRLHRPRYETA